MVERPETPFALLIVAGLLIQVLGVSWSAIMVLFSQPSSVTIVFLDALICGIGVLTTGILLYAFPVHHVIFGVLGIALSVLSLLSAGGFFIGLILGIIGGALGISWKPPVAQQRMAKQRSGLVTAGGILVITASCIALIGGIIALTWGLMFGFMIVFAVVGFASGLTAGIQSLRRKTFVISIIGTALLMVSRILSLICFFALFFLLLQVPTLIFSLLGLIFVAVKKQDFT